jgi:hypothetical protein
MAKKAYRERLLLCIALFVFSGVFLVNSSPFAQIICQGDPGFPESATISDTLIPPVIEWAQEPFYPTESFSLDSIPSRYNPIQGNQYLLETEFPYFGVPVDFDPDEIYPPHYFLPQGWQGFDMMTLRWNEPENPQMVREPILKLGAHYIDDPGTWAGDTDTLLITSQLDLFGSYEGTRDQLFKFNLRIGTQFLGDSLFSYNPDSGDSVLAWTAHDLVWDEMINASGDTTVAVGENIVLTTQVDWQETYDIYKIEGLNLDYLEYAFAPGDLARDGTLILSCTWERFAPDSIRMTASDIGCAHYVDRGLWVSFSPGILDSDFRSEIVAETFEGFAVWRKIAGSSSDWENIWKIAKNEESDKFYWWWVGGDYDPTVGYNPDDPDYWWNFYGLDLNTLQEVFGPDGERVYLDFDVHNGFVYDYAVVSFDRGFRPNNGDNNHEMIFSTPKESLFSIGLRDTLNWGPSPTVDNVLYAVPNPLRTGRSAIEDPDYHNYPGNVMRFVGVRPGVTMKVYTLAGDLVYEALHEDPTSRNMIWNTRNLAGELVASGVYIALAKGPDGDEEYCRLAIIR